MTKQQRSFNGEKIVLSTNDAERTGHRYAKKKKKKSLTLDKDLIPLTINSKYIIDLKGRHKAMKRLENNTGEHLNDL